MNFTDSLRLHATLYPDRECVLYQERHVSFSQLNTRANKIAHAVHGLGLTRGDVVAVLLHNCYEWIEIFHALARIGVTMVPVNYHLVPREIEHIVNNSESKALIFGSEFTDRIEQTRANFNEVSEDRLIRIGERGLGREYESWLAHASSDEAMVPVNETDVLYLGYTSGTTGFPKGARVMNGTRLAHALLFCHEFHFTGRDRILINMPLFHSNALVFSNLTIYLGGSAAIMPRFDAEGTLATMEHYRTTTSSMVPTQFERILSLSDDVKNKYDVSSMKTFVCSSSPLHPRTRLSILDFFSRADLYEFYGSSEGGVVTLMLPEDHAKKPSSIGRAAFLQRVRLLDDEKKDVPQGEMGEIYSRGVMQFDGYYKMPEATAEAMHEGFFTAGDMAYMDEEGYFYLTDRKKDMIISGAENVYPVEIEQAISLHPKVFEAAVIGVPDKDWGEVPKAIVVCREGEQVTEAEILEYCQANLAKYKCPKSVEFMDSLPRNALGKILKRQLREKYWEGHDVRIA
ncbi:MAG: long-chain-fatty-acid--CoA ligase [Deltaproteobacteria bacterium]|nr:long-chain-fatty-acid--CoA ligase [Deltaproteobacteria bacterium]